MIEAYTLESLLKKYGIDATKVINKKIIIIIAFCILIFICLSILSLEIRNWIIDTAFENLKVISN